MCRNLTINNNKQGIPHGRLSGVLLEINGNDILRMEGKFPSLSLIWCIEKSDQVSQSTRFWWNLTTPLCWINTFNSIETIFSIQTLWLIFDSFFTITESLFTWTQWAVDLLCMCLSGKRFWHYKAYIFLLHPKRRNGF